MKGDVISDHFFMLWFQKEKRERIWPKEEKKNGKEKKKNIWRKEIYGPQRRKRMEREKGENIWRRKRTNISLRRKNCCEWTGRDSKAL